MPSKHPWRAAAEVFAVNAFVNRFDAWVLNEDYAKINIHTIKSNFRHAFVWDNDNFSTNLFAHPYHGNLYFNSARSNGMSFFQSLPYALGGSLMWEFFGEDTPPAINDLMATTIGGSCIGEVAYRVSNLAYDDRERGFSRFMREMLGFVVNPMRGFNRLMTGEAWRVRPDGNDYHDFKQLPIGVSLSAGTRYIADNNSLFRGEHLPYVDFILDYGNPFCEETNKPYDYFNANITFGLGSRQPVISNIHLLGRIWNASVYETDDMELDFGLFQHFNFYNSEPVKDGSDIVPFRISEAAAIGPGVIYQFRNIGNLSQLEQRIFVDAILLGGSMSDYLRVQERDYNMGSGYSVKLQTMLEFGRYGSFRLNTGFYQIFTWKGYDADYIASMDNQNYSNTQGDVGNSALLVVNPRVSLHVWNHFNFNLQGSYYFRRTYYRHHLNVHARTFEFRAGLSFDI
ncbi:MAG: DUF3943 domain-containing protein [Prevotella sp.]|nr:DUF3943 domain-containing protein [Prevotella sp.]